MRPTTYLGLEKEFKPVDIMEYKQMIGSLLYLTVSRLDIMFRVCLCARFQSNLRELHLTKIKRIFRYHKGTTNLGLSYKERENFSLQGYCDANYSRDKVEGKSISGCCHFVGGNLIPWTSRKQGMIVLSIGKVEYVSVAQCF